MQAKTVKVQIERNQVFLATQCQIADDFLSRLRGLIGEKNFVQGRGLLITPCRDIHMWFMKIPIDAVFVKPTDASKGKRFVVTSLHRSLRPWKFFPVLDLKAIDTFELPEGTIDRCDLQVGDTLCIS